MAGVVANLGPDPSSSGLWEICGPYRSRARSFRASPNPASISSTVGRMLSSRAPGIGAHTEGAFPCGSTSQGGSGCGTRCLVQELLARLSDPALSLLRSSSPAGRSTPQVHALVGHPGHCRMHWERILALDPSPPPARAADASPSPPAALPDSVPVLRLDCAPRFLGDRRQRLTLDSNVVHAEGGPVG